VCSIQLQGDDKLLEKVSQDMLETVVPQVGEKVMTLVGEYSGKLGKLMAKSKETCVVQMIGDLTVNTFNLDDIAQYTGEDDELY